MASPDPIRKHLLDLLRMKGAHLNFEETTGGFPTALRGLKPKGAPHTPWQLLEHLRIAQWDILDFSRNPDYPRNEIARRLLAENRSPARRRRLGPEHRALPQDLEAMEDTHPDPHTDLTARIPHGNGQTLLREALLVADHNAYHIGQLVLVRKMLEGK